MKQFSSYLYTCMLAGALSVSAHNYAFSQSTDTYRYQGRLKVGGIVQSNKPTNITFSVMNQQNTVDLFNSQQELTTNTDGVFQANLNIPTTVFTQNSNTNIRIKVNSIGSTTYNNLFLPSTPIASTAYSTNSRTWDGSTISGGTAAQARTSLQLDKNQLGDKWINNDGDNMSGEYSFYDINNNVALKITPQYNQLSLHGPIILNAIQGYFNSIYLDQLVLYKYFFYHGTQVNSEFSLRDEGSLSFERTKVSIKENTSLGTAELGIAVDLWNNGTSQPDFMSTYLTSNSKRHGNNTFTYITTHGTANSKFSTWLLGMVSGNNQSSTSLNTADDSIVFIYGSPGQSGEAATINKTIGIHPDGALSFQPVNTSNPLPSYFFSSIGSPNAFIKAKNTSGTTELFAYDSAGNQSQLSSHAHPAEKLASASSISKSSLTSNEKAVDKSSFSDPTVDLPWSFSHENSYIGKGQVVDMAKLVQYVEKQMKKELGEEEGKVVYTYSLPAESFTDTDEIARMVVDSKVSELAAKPDFVQLSMDGKKIPADCWEEYDEIEMKEVEKTEVIEEINWETMEVVTATKTTKSMEPTPTGKKLKRLKSNVVLREGKVYRLKTIDDIVITEEDLPKLPEHIRMRMPSGDLSSLQSKVQSVLTEKQIAFREAQKIDSSTEDRKVANATSGQ